MLLAWYGTEIPSQCGHPPVCRLKVGQIFTFLVQLDQAWFITSAQQDLVGAQVVEPGSKNQTLMGPLYKILI